MNCYKCNAENIDEAVYCYNCGSRLDGKVTCKNCGKTVDGNYKFCIYCGSNLSVSQTTPTVNETSVVSTPQASRPQIVKPKPEVTENAKFVLNDVISIISFSLICLLFVFSFFFGAYGELSVKFGSVSAREQIGGGTSFYWMVTELNNLQAALDKIDLTPFPLVGVIAQYIPFVATAIVVGVGMLITLIISACSIKPFITALKTGDNQKLNGLLISQLVAYFAVFAFLQGVCAMNTINFNVDGGRIDSSLSLGAVPIIALILSVLSIIAIVVIKFIVKKPTASEVKKGVIFSVVGVLVALVALFAFYPLYSIKCKNADLGQSFSFGFTPIYSVAFELDAMSTTICQINDIEPSSIGIFFPFTEFLVASTHLDMQKIGELNGELITYLPEYVTTIILSIINLVLCLVTFILSLISLKLTFKSLTNERSVNSALGTAIATGVSSTLYFIMSFVFALNRHFMVMRVTSDNNLEKGLISFNVGAGPILVLIFGLISMIISIIVISVIKRKKMEEEFNLGLGVA